MCECKYIYYDDVCPIISTQKLDSHGNVVNNCPYGIKVDKSSSRTCELPKK